MPQDICHMQPSIHSGTFSIDSGLKIRMLPPQRETAVK